MFMFHRIPEEHRDQAVGIFLAAILGGIFLGVSVVPQFFGSPLRWPCLLALIPAYMALRGGHKNMITFYNETADFYRP